VSCTITVGIPTKDRAGYLRGAIDSVLAQVYTDFEIIVSDNASSDETPDLVRSYGDSRIVYLRQDHDLGMVGNFNACLSAATGRYFIMLSDDDLFFPTALANLVEPLVQDDHREHPLIGMSWAPCSIIDANGAIMWSTRGAKSSQTAVEMLLDVFNGINGPRFCSVLVRTKDARAVGGYSERHGELCDWGNWARVVARYPSVHCSDQPLAAYRVHAKSFTKSSDIRHWTKLVRNINEDIIAEFAGRNDVGAVRTLSSAARNNVSNIIITILLQSVGQKGWILFVASQIARVPRDIFRPFVLRRILRDGWKLGALRKRRSH
jgi:glycosyltransferase involved in cell wall biosynthesis